MTRMERSIEVRAPPEKVWELLAWDRLPEWHPSIKRAEYTSKKREGFADNQFLLLAQCEI